MKLYFKSFGQGASVVLLHGLYGSSDNWQSIAKKLADNYQVIVPDLRNHGRSPHSYMHNYLAMALDVIDLLNDIGLDKAIIVGHSMGGKVAMQMAFSYPQRVQKLVVVDIAPKAYQQLLSPAQHVLEHLNILQGITFIDLSQITSRQQADDELSPFISDKSTRQFILKNLVRENDSFRWAFNLEALTKALPEILSGFDNEKLIKNNTQFDKQTLFIRGENSHYIEKEDFDTINALFPHNEIVTIPDAGHGLHVEKPDVFLKVLSDFLFQKDK
jgi:pimeloyl-ACP methyl ester carboxylesterase